MIDAKKVRMMTKLAIYEQGEGKAARKIYRYSRRTYLNAKQLASFFALTAAYILAAALYCFLYMDDILIKGFGYDYKPLILRLLIGYILVLVVGLFITGRRYRKHYDSMLDSLKRYDYDLYHLSRYLEREEES